MTTALVVAEKPHSELGASVAARWMNCPGSIQLSRALPPLPTSVFAEEGTAAHALAELSLRRAVDPSTFVGTTLEGFEVTEEMADFVRVYTDYCGTLMDEPGNIHFEVEKRFNLGALNPPGPMFGTADFVAYNVNNRTLHVVDLKYGQGVVVEVKGNKQLRYYGLGAALASPSWLIEQVEITVVQPRAQHPDGVIRRETINLGELVEYGAELMAAARLTQEPGAPLVAGDWCRFCPATGQCPAQRARAEEVAMVEFSAMPLDVPPDPNTLPAEVFSDVLGKLHILEDWAKSVRAVAFNRLERGEDVPGFKLVAKRPTRYWRDTAETEQWLKAEGHDGEEIYKQELKSPAQIEKLVGKKNLPLDLQVKRSSGYSMAPEHDPRPPISIQAGEEFGVIPAPSEATSTRQDDETNAE